MPGVEDSTAGHYLKSLSTIKKSECANLKEKVADIWNRR